MEVRWVADNSGMRVGAKQADRKDMEDLEKMERRSMEEEVRPMQSTDQQQNMDLNNLEKMERGESMQSTVKTNMKEKKPNRKEL